VYQYLDRMIQRGFELLGISQLAAQARKDAGVTAAVAMREANDLQTDRLSVIATSYQDLFVDLAKLAITTMKEWQTRDKSSARKYEVKSEGSKFLKTISWGDCDLEDDAYEVKVWPVALLPQSPQAKLQQITEFVQSGWITPKAARHYMTTLDLDYADDLANAAQDRVDMVIDSIVDDGKYGPEHAPDDSMDIDYAIEQSLSMMNYSIVNGLEPERIALLTTFRNDLASEQSNRMQSMAPAPGQMPAGAVPQGVAPKPPPAPMMAQQAPQ
jgi:hypothetical protein